MNTPYVKQFNADGSIANPITKATPYLTVEPNRRDRRFKEGRFLNNRKTFHLSVTPSSKFKRFVQIIGDKKIYHYLAVY